MTTDVETVPMTVRADWMPGPPQGCWTVADYEALPDDGNRYEMIDGVLYMAAAPNIRHQETSMRFSIHLGSYVQLGGLGRVFAAPCDVVLPPGVPVQPDLIVVLNANLGIIGEQKIVGTPELVVEIASPGTAGFDRRTKQDAYARAGVPEYWIADPYARTVEVLALDGGVYRSLGVYTGAATIPSRVLPGLPVRVEQLFP